MTNARPGNDPEELEPTGVLAVLARHQRRREQGVPTLSVLVGLRTEAVAAWRAWAESAGRRLRIIERDVPLPAMDPEDAAGQNTQPDDAVLYLGDGTETYRDQGKDSPGGGAQASAAALARSVERLCRLLDTPQRVFLANAGALPACRALALAVEPNVADAYLLREPYHRAKAIFAEGTIFLAEPGGSTRIPIAQREPVEPPPPLPPSLRVAALPPETLACLEEARASLREAASTATPPPPAAQDRARSAAERFLFDLLADLPETTGLFELNGRLDFCFGPMRAEVDLLARRLRLAVEIDGFHHFQDPERYRRDRRKDALLQRQDYLVLRFLAEDVVMHLEEVLEEIRATVAFRRLTAGAGAD